MDPITQHTLDQSAQMMADGLKIMNPEAVKVLQLEAYTLGMQHERARKIMQYIENLEEQRVLIERLTAKLKQLESAGQ